MKDGMYSSKIPGIYGNPDAKYRIALFHGHACVETKSAKPYEVIVHHLKRG